MSPARLTTEDELTEVYGVHDSEARKILMSAIELAKEEEESDTDSWVSTCASHIWLVGFLQLFTLLILGLVETLLFTLHYISVSQPFCAHDHPVIITEEATFLSF